MVFKLNPCKILDCYEIQPLVTKDKRGSFTKIFHADLFSKLKLPIDFREEYYSKSTKGVIRGMHFQIPPHDHAKLVYCVQGDVLDVVVDLRIGSPSYGNIQSFMLSANKGNCIYIPRGLAHGFLVMSNEASMVYKVTSQYSKEHDKGILWNSLNFTWPISVPIVSDRDLLLPPISEFESPFLYE